MEKATAMIYGFHAIDARLRYKPESVQMLYVAAQRKDSRVQQLLALAKQHALKYELVEETVLNTLSGRAAHQGMLAMVKPCLVAKDLCQLLAQRPQLLLILDGITDPHNLGACLRVADAMGVDAVIAPKDRAVGLNATVAKVACGAAETVPYLSVTNLARTLRTLKQAGIWLVGADMDSDTELFNFELAAPLAWVMGAEGHGLRRLSREHCDYRVRIPMFGTVQSLNVAVATGICLAHSRRQQCLPT